MRIRLAPTFPLLGKDLLELAARPRTYALRAAMALGLLAVFLISYGSLAARADPRLGLIGHGGLMLSPLVWALAAAALLVAPTSSAVAIAAERERGSLVTLLLTPMRPWELVAQKWASRQLALLPLVALALPLFAVCYAFGGLDPRVIALDAYVLVLTSAQMGALGIAVGAWCRTVTGAVFCSFLSMVGVLAVCPLGFAILAVDQIPVAGSWISEYGTGLDPLTALRMTEIGWRWGGTRAPGMGDVLRWSWPALASIPLLLVVARLGVVRHSDGGGGGGLLLRLFLGLDRLFVRAEARIGRRVARELPSDAPVAWREINRRALANTRYLIRLGIPLVAGTAGLCTLVGLDWRRNSYESYSLVYDGVLGLGAVAMLALAIPLVEGERARQTLDVLLTTPLRGRDIVVQKQRALRRLHVLIALLPLVVVMWQAYAVTEWRHREATLAAECGTALLLPAAMSWIGCLVGLLIRGRGRAGALAVTILAAWLALPLLVEPIARALGMSTATAQERRFAQQYGETLPGLPLAIAAPIQAISPVGLLRLAGGVDIDWYWYRDRDVDWEFVIGCGLGAQALAWLAARGIALRVADAALRRGANHA